MSSIKATLSKTMYLFVLSISIIFIYGFSFNNSLLIEEESLENSTVTLMFNWHGGINDSALSGYGSLFIDQSTGDFNAVANFTDHPDSFNGMLASSSLLSVSCSNGG